MSDDPFDFAGQVALVVMAVVFAYRRLRRRRGPAGHEHGSASLATDGQIARAGMFRPGGLLLGRSLVNNRPIWLHDYVHLSMFATTGGGKGVSYFIPWLLTFRRGSVFVNDPKGELYQKTADARRAMGRVVRIDPFGVCGPGADTFNPFDLCRDGEAGIDDAGALAEAMVVRTGEEKEPHWAEQAAANIKGAASYLLARPRGERTFAALRHVLAVQKLRDDCARAMAERGGIYAWLAGVMLEPQKEEKSSVASSIHTHTKFLDSPAVLPSLESGWDAAEFLRGSVTVYFVLPPMMVESQSRYLRLVLSSLVRLVCDKGMAPGREGLFLVDEAGTCLGGPTPAVNRALDIGRSYGLRMVLAFQSTAQLRSLFRGGTESLVFDNTQPLFFNVRSLENAKLVSEMIGNKTETSVSYNASEGDNTGRGESFGHHYSTSTSRGSNRGHGASTSRHPRPVFYPDEILAAPGMIVFAFIKDLCAPLVLKRVLSYSDPLFTGKPGRLLTPTRARLLAGTAFGMLVWGVLTFLFPDWRTFRGKREPPRPAQPWPAGADPFAPPGRRPGDGRDGLRNHRVDPFRQR